MRAVGKKKDHILGSCNRKGIIIVKVDVNETMIANCRRESGGKCSANLDAKNDPASIPAEGIRLRVPNTSGSSPIS